MVAELWPEVGHRNLSDRDVRHRPQTRRIVGTRLTDREVLTSEPVLETVQIDPARREAAHQWVRQSLDALTFLGANWDYHGGRTIAREALDLAEQLVVPLIASGLPAPAFVPTSDGGVSLEWHGPAIEFVIQVPRGNEPPTAYFSDEQSGEEWEESLISGALRYRDALARLIQQEVAGV